MLAHGCHPQKRCLPPPSVVGRGTCDACVLGVTPAHTGKRRRPRAGPEDRTRGHHTAPLRPGHVDLADGTKDKPSGWTGLPARGLRAVFDANRESLAKARGRAPGRPPAPVGLGTLLVRTQELEARPGPLPPMGLRPVWVARLAGGAPPAAWYATRPPSPWWPGGPCRLHVTDVSGLLVIQCRPWGQRAGSTGALLCPLPAGRTGRLWRGLGRRHHRVPRAALAGNGRWPGVPAPSSARASQTP